MKVAEVDACQYQNWYAKFSEYSFKTTIVKLNEEFLEYLRADGVMLPECGKDKIIAVGDENSDEEDWENDKNENEPLTPAFPDLEGKIERAIAEYGHVYPKLNWSAPRDATWVVTNNIIKCGSVVDVFLLIKSSDFVEHDLSHAYENCEDEFKPERPAEFFLILKKWYALNPSMEFRCFIRDDKLIAISHRDESVFYAHLQPALSGIVQRIQSFFTDKISGEFEFSNFTMDVYVGVNKIYIVDFNPWGDTTDSLLFNWSDLLDPTFPKNNENENGSIMYGETAVRIIEDDAGVQPNPFQYSRMPRDAFDIMTGQGLEKFVELCRQQEEESSDDDDDDDNNNNTNNGNNNTNKNGNGFSINNSDDKPER